MRRKRIVVLGSTGSIGTQTLEIADAHRETLEVVGLGAHRNARRLVQQVRAFGPRAVCLADHGACTDELAGEGVEVWPGPEGLCRLAALPEADLVVAAVSGVAGLLPVLEALRTGKDVALANKEPLVAAGRLVTNAAQASGARLLPVDSELSAIFQALQGEDTRKVEKILLTASGGPFAQMPAEALDEVTPAQALAHPTWRMGRKVTVDSATLANKGFEIFETMWLFGVAPKQIEVVVHHQSVIHSMVQFIDGSIIGQMGLPDMRTPIQYALFYPERQMSAAARLDLPATGSLTFAAPDLQRFPALRLAREAAEAGGTYPAVFNAADEVAVERFLAGEIRFTDIPRLCEAALEAHTGESDEALCGILAADAWAREFLREAAGTGNRA